MKATRPPSILTRPDCSATPRAAGAIPSSRPARAITSKSPPSVSAATSSAFRASGASSAMRTAYACWMRAGSGSGLRS
ncbi:hypothetical protein ACQP2K_02410 [Microbispora siamensis]